MNLRLLFSFLFAGAAVFAQTADIEQYATGFTNIAEIVNDGSEGNKLYVVQQNGQIRILQEDGTINPNPFVTVTSIRAGIGEGLMGLAFHPEYATNGYFYVFYITFSGDIEIARYTRSTANPELADATSKTVLLNIPHPNYGEKNGGCLRFGPDGYLYISTGDGNLRDVAGNAQNLDSLLGKILRIDVNNGTPYGIPPTNPFVNTDGADEIWAYGLRDPLKFSFDTNGTMWITDRNENRSSEINKVDPATAGYNFGWRCYAGSDVYDAECANSNTMTAPYAQLSGTNAMIGGYVYRGEEFPDLQGKYIFTDMYNGMIGWLDASTPGEPVWGERHYVNFSAFGQDSSGNLYVGIHNNGVIHKIVQTSTADTDQFGKTIATVHPNPAHGEVFVTLKTEKATATIFDLSGKQLMQQQLSAQKSRIDISLFQTGVYILEVNTNNGSVQQKLVVN